MKDNFTISLFTHRFVGTKREASRRVHLDTWVPDKGFLHNANLYRDKVANLMGKELMFSSISFPPATVVQVGNGTTTYDGFEYTFIREWAKRYNFTWKVIYNQDEWWGEVYPNGSGIGITGYLSMDWVDLSFADLIVWYKESLFTDFRY